MATDEDRRPKGSGGFPSRAGSVFGKLEQVFDDVWWAWGTVRFMPGVLFPRTMTVVRERGELVVIHPVLLPEAEQARLEALGPIKHIVRLGAFHGMDDPAYIERYKPTAWAPAGVDHRPGARTDRELRPGAELPFGDAALACIEKSRTPEVVLRLARHDGLLLACDSVQNWERTSGTSLLGGLMARAMGFRGRACIGPGWRSASEPKDGVGFAADFRRILDWDFRHAIGGHGPPIKGTAKDDLRAQTRKLYGDSS